MVSDFLGPSRLFVAAFLAALWGAAPAAAQPAAQWRQRQPKLFGSGSLENPYQGSSVAISRDGQTAIIGGIGDNSGIGAAWIWIKTATGWVQQGPKLVGSGGSGLSHQGSAVALSADGNTALVGGGNDNGGIGAVWVWTRSSGVWIQQDKLVGSGSIGAAVQGSSVALSADGNTAMIGGPADDTNKGAVWVWARQSGVWLQQGSKLVTPTVTAVPGRFGHAVAISADGTTAIVGAPFDSEAPAASAWAGAPPPDFSQIGGAIVWTRTGAVWTPQGPKLVGTGVSTSVRGAHQGWSVALSADGDTALVGAGLASEEGVWVWTRTAGVWTQQGPRLRGTGSAFSAGQGQSVALSADGNIALVGGPYDDRPDNDGAAWLWTRRNGQWLQWGQKIYGSDSTQSSSQGWSVSLSGDGHSALLGGYSNDSLQGGAWMFSAIAPADFDGDGTSDRTVFRWTTGVWYSRFNSGNTTATLFGAPSPHQAAADFDGDGKTDLAVLDSAGGVVWRISQSSDQSIRQVNWGAGGDSLMAGDVDGDGKADQVAWRSTTGTWFVKRSSGGISGAVWGVDGDWPLLGDFDGDHRDDFVIYRPSAGQWFVLLSGGGTQSIHWGLPDDVPVIGDWDRDGRADYGIFRPSTGHWFIYGSASGFAGAVQWGTEDDIPMGVDVDGDGFSDLTVWRPSNGAWYTRFGIGGGTATVQWGTAGDSPVGRGPG